MPLLNAFIDSITCVGFNAERGLTTERQAEEDVIPILSYLKPYVLAILTSDYAIYPELEGKLAIDSSYPFITHPKYVPPTISKLLKKQSISTIINNLPTFCTPDGIKISHNPIESRIHHIVFTQEEGKRSYAVVLTFQEKFILKNEKPNEDGVYQIESIPMYTSQTTKKGSRTRPSAYRHTTANPLANIQVYSSSNLARRGHYGSSTSLDCVGKNTDPSDSSISTSRMRSGSNLSLSSRLGGSSSSLVFDATESFYVPHFLVLTSTHPYWTAMHEVISTIYNQIRQEKIELNSEIYKKLIQKYAFFVCHTPIPSIAWDRFSLSFNLTADQSFITLDPPIHTNRSVLDLDLSILLLTLNIGKLIDVLSAILTQQPMIFFSADYSKLVTTLECLIYLIYPFKWIHTYIPIVPHSLRDYCLEGPPGSYIMGVHSRYQSIAEEMDASFLCNLDDDKTIHVPSDTEFSRIPSTKLRRFIVPITDFVEKIKMERSLQNMHTPTYFRIEEKHEYERRQRLQTNNRIIEIFLDLMVDICDDTLNAIYWKVDHHQQSSPTNTLQRTTTNSLHTQSVFSKEKYLLSKTKGVEKEFYHLFISTTAFELFIEEERTSKTPTEFRKICQVRSQLSQDLFYHFNTSTTNTQSKPTLSLFETQSTQMLLPLPDWPSDISIHYLDLCIEAFTHELETAQRDRSSPVINIYAYLRGCAYIARGEYLKGLEDFYLIENLHLFPKDYIQTIIVPLLSELGLFEKFQEESFYQNASEWKKLPQSRHSSLTSIDYPPLPTFEGNLTFEQFYDYVQRSSIIDGKETAAILFHALLHWVVKPTDVNKARRRLSLGGNTSKESTNSPLLIAKSSQTMNASPSLAIPGKLFELFLEVWQQTNAEKARMFYFLPKDRQKQESILMISSHEIISKAHGRGKLILTQRGLYLLPEGHSSALLLTDLLKIVTIDIYQHRTFFSSPKPAIRIYALQSTCSTNIAVPINDGEPLDMLILRDNYEQNFWFKIIDELWSGVSIAQAECDTNVLLRTSRNIALMDALANIDGNDLNNEKKTKTNTCIELAINDLSIFTRMRKNGTFKQLTPETRNAFVDRISPSINETERHSVHCLIITEYPESDYNLLWCAYGNKLKIFNTKTWICDPNVLLFPSKIQCMCLDTSNKLWIGCINGRIYLVDTIQRICGTQLTSIEGTNGCQTMAFDTIRNQMIIANQDSLVQIWNTITKQFVMNMNFDDMYKNNRKIKQKIQEAEMFIKYKNQIQDPNIAALNDSEDDTPKTPNQLRVIEIHGDLLFACYRDDYVLILYMDNYKGYVYDQVVSVKYKNSSISINTFLIYNQQLWISAGYIISVYNIHKESKKRSFDLAMRKYFEDDHLLTMLGVSNYVWAGSSRGNIYIFRMDNYELLKTFNGHKDGVCCLCPMFDTHVISGSKRDDKSIVIWENMNTDGIVQNTRF